MVADTFAKKGAIMHRVSERVRDAYVASWSDLQDLAKYLATVWCTVWSSSKRIGKRPARDDDYGSLVVLKHSHEYDYVGDTVVCVACKRSASTVQTKAHLDSTPCNPPSFDFLRQYRMHSFMIANDVIWCSSCAN